MRNSGFGERAHLKGTGWEMTEQGTQWSPGASVCVHTSTQLLKEYAHLSRPSLVYLCQFQGTSVGKRLTMSEAQRLEIPGY